MMLTSPRVSVIVPVRNRRDLLAQMLDALAAQTYRDFEVVVVDDGSSDGADLEALSRREQGQRVKLLRSGGAGAVAARRFGVSEAEGSVLAFTDSDCIPDPKWLDRGLAMIDAGCQMVNGLTEPLRPVGPLERSMGSATEGLYPTCNMFFDRAVYERFGGFDQGAATRLGFRFNERARGTGFGEDTILGWRMIRAGIPYGHAADAVVRHHVFPADPVEWVSRAIQMAAFPSMVREVPELRRTLLRRRVLLGPRNRVPIYLLVLAVGLRRRRPALAALLWWSFDEVKSLRRAPGPWPRKLAWLPAEMALDALVAAALIAGSLRSRTLVL